MRALAWAIVGSLVALTAFGVVAAAPAKNAPPATTTIRLIRPQAAPSTYGNQGGEEDADVRGICDIYKDSVGFPPSVFDFSSQTWSGARPEITDEFPDPLCLHATLGRGATFVCGLELTSPKIDVVLEPAATMSGRIVAADGTPAANASVGLLIQGVRHVHRIVFPTKRDGSFAVTRIPASLLRASETEFLAFAQGQPDLRMPLPRDVGRAPIDARFAPGRRVRAHLVGDGKSDDWTYALAPDVALRTPPTGQSEFLDLRVPETARRLVVVPMNHQAMTIDLPASPTDLDLGEVVLASGKDVTGRIHSTRPPEVGVVPEIGVFDSEGVCVRVGGLSSDHGRFALNHVGPGAHRMAMRIEQPGRTFLDRHVVVEDVVAGGEPLDVVVPTACLAVEFRGEDGKPLAVKRGTVMLHAPRDPLGEPHRFFTTMARDAVSPTRVEMDPRDAGVAFRVVVRAPGYRPVETSLTTDKNGAGTVVVVLREE